jgi:hypothetical protein
MFISSTPQLQELSQNWQRYIAECKLQLSRNKVWLELCVMCNNVRVLSFIRNWVQCAAGLRWVQTWRFGGAIVRASAGS